MYKKYKSEIKEIIEIVKECPESLQEKCFEILLNKLLEGEKKNSSNSKKSDQVLKPLTDTNETTDVESESNSNSTAHEEYEIGLVDLHVKTKKFLDENELSIKHINELFYKEDGEIKPLYEDLNCTQMAECQIRLALLTGLENGLSTGEFIFDVEFVRERCKAHKCYDAGNFLTNFRNNKRYWDNFSDYKDNSVKVSTDGKTELANVIKDIS